MPRWTHTLFAFVQDQASAGWTHLDGGAFTGGVALVPAEADTGHGADGQRVEHGAFGVQTARLGKGARVNALTTDTSCLGRAVQVRGTPNLN